MGQVARSAEASIDQANAVNAIQISGDLYAGEDLGPVAHCYIAAADGKVYEGQKDDGAGSPAADEKSRAHGVTARAVKQGEPLTLFREVRARYADSGVLTPGAPYYAGDGGLLDDAPTTGDPDGIAFAVSDTDIIFTGRRPTEG